MCPASSGGPVILFDVFRTLLAFDGDHVGDETFPFLARWLAYRSWPVDSDELHLRYGEATSARLEAAPGSPPDVDVVEVWSDTLADLVGRRPDLSLVRDLCLIYRQITTRSIGVWPGTPAMLDACDGVRVGVASNTQRAYTESELRMFGLDERFEAVVFSSDVGAAKPDPAVLHEVLARLGTSPDRAIYIGDDAHDDVVAGERAGIPVILLDRSTPTADGVERPAPLACVPGDQPVKAVEIARRHLGVTDR